MTGCESPGFAEGNHVCAVCVANGNCELQDFSHGSWVWIIVVFSYRFPKREVDIPHPLFGIDHNRCVLCTVVCESVMKLKGAHVPVIPGLSRRKR
ncbi:MAG UNVERIFIED_CONTAM: hypothetical protein LVR29_11370 [Microcystis novacekii LVE1205-3]